MIGAVDVGWCRRAIGGHHNGRVLVAAAANAQVRLALGVRYAALHVVDRVQAFLANDTHNQLDLGGQNYII